MTVELRIALRYLISRKSHGAINVISAVAMAGVAVAAAAMIIVLSVFNGFAQLVDSKISTFNPPYLLTDANGAVIANADSLAAAILTPAGASASNPRDNRWLPFPIIDEQAFAMTDAGAQMPVNFRALPPEVYPYYDLTPILVDGSIPRSRGNAATVADDFTTGNKISADSAAILSVGVAMQLKLRPGDSIRVFLPRRTGRINPGALHRAFRSVNLPVAAVYQVEQDTYDRDMLIIPLQIARSLLNYTTEATSVGFVPRSGTAGLSTPATLTPPLCDNPGSAYRMLDRRGQEEESFRMIAIEKWITFLMLSFIMLIASFNIISTLSLMVVEKQGNMAVLRAMGASPGFIRNIFANQAWLITLCGGFIGLLIGSLLILGQQHYGWVPLATSNPAVLSTTSYPVLLTLPDLLICSATLLILSGLLTLLCRRLPRQ